MHCIFSSPCAVECLDKNIIRFEGSKFVDSGGGFLIEEVTGQTDNQVCLETSQIYLIDKIQLVKKQHFYEKI